MTPTIKRAIEIFREKLPEAKGKFRPAVSERNKNEVEFFCESGLYCTINIRSGAVKGI